jgi:23S rRNA-/tRNA-specific pseudouridylate synthase
LESKVHQMRGFNPRWDQMKVLFQSDAYIVVDKAWDTRLNGEFSETVEKFLLQKFPHVEQIRFPHQIDFATSVGTPVESFSRLRVFCALG